MNPIIRKKDKGKRGARYILEWEEDGKICTFTLNPAKLLDYAKKSKKIKGKSK